MTAPPPGGAPAGGERASPPDASPSTPHKAPSVRRQLATMLAIAVAPAMALAIAYGVRAYSDETARAEAQFQRETEVAAQAQRDAFVRTEAALRALADAPALRAENGPDCDAALARLDASFPEVTLALSIGVDGRVRCASDPDAVGMDLSEAENFDDFIADPRLDVTVVRAGRVTGRHVFVITLPQFRDGALSGMVTASIPVAFLQVLAAPDDPVDGMIARRAVVSVDGEKLAPLGDAGWLPAPQALRDAMARGERGVAAPARDGAAVFYALSPMVRDELWMVAAAPTDTLYAGALQRAALPIIAPLLMLMLAVGVAYAGVNNLVVRHVVHLARITRAYGQGRFSLRPKLDNAPQELAMLGEDLAEMADRLDQREAALRQSAEDNRLLLLEVYHRVKNNLQMIVSLLHLQTRNAASPAERAALHTIQTRIHSLSLVHEQLYADGSLAEVALDRLISAMTASLPPTPARPAIALDLDALTETAARAAPLALFVNEALTDALARGDPAARIALSLKDDGAGGYILRLAASADPASPPPDRLRERLMSGFAGQLGATMTRSAEGDALTTVLVAPAAPRQAASEIAAPVGQAPEAGTPPPPPPFP